MEQNNMRGVLSQINVSGGGMPKLPVAEGKVASDGIDGDWQLNRKYHGGPNRAICLYSEELYRWLNEQGVKVAFGQLGENFTTRGIDLLKLKRGMRLRVGECEIEITEPRTPCTNLKQWHPDLKKLMVGRSGWLAKVLRGGTVRPGDEIGVIGGDE